MSTAITSFSSSRMTMGEYGATVAVMSEGTILRGNEMGERKASDSRAHTSSTRNPVFARVEDRRACNEVTVVSHQSFDW